MKHALVKGSWFVGYTGTGQFLPHSVELFDTEALALDALTVGYNETGEEWFVVPVETPEEYKERLFKLAEERNKVHEAKCTCKG